MTSELQKNQLALAELERENAWKEMAKQVAHEIKNPLTPLKLAVQQLIASYRDKSKNFDSIFEKVSATILNQVENLNLIASEFSRFAKMPTLKLEEVDLLSVIRDSADLFIDENIKINIETELDKVFIEADINQLRRMMINLIRNSIQAGATSITISADCQDDNYIMKVTDNGSGIMEEFRDKIFEANFSTKEKGMGLGLKMAKRFLEGINGTIYLEENSPEIKQGITFRITIPALSRNGKQ
jgi:nitrogen fixation/metabolism regulation signal transduction histidine kinase